MNGTTFAEYIRKQTKTNTTTLPNADIVVLANVIKDDIAAAIVSEVDENYFDIEMLRDLEVGVRDYTFPNDLLKHMKYCAAKLDGSDWVYLTEEDISHFENPLLEESEIVAQYASEKPRFYISGRSLKILSGDAIIAVTEGLKIIGEIYPEDIDASDLSATDDLSIPSSNTTHALPRAVHKIWAMKVIVEYKQSRDKPLPLTQEEKMIEIAMAASLQKLQKRNAVRSFVATVPKDDGQDY